ncbi:MAG: APC family permease [Novosphingobium sp.]
MEDTDKRPFGFWTAAALVVGGVIGAGIFVLPSQLAAYGWTAVGAWIFGGFGAILIALVLSAVAEAKPDEPGLIAVIGETLGPVAGVLAGFGAWVSYWCANAYIALTSVRYAGTFLPDLAATPQRQAVSASVLIAALTLLNLSGLKSSGRFQVVTTVLKLVPLIAVVAIVAAMLMSGGGELSRYPQAQFDGTKLFDASSLAFAAIMGFESAAIAAQRVRNPRRNVPRATIIGVVLTCLLYLVVCTGVIFGLPADVVANSNAPVAEFVGASWGGWAKLAVAAFAVISTVGCLNVWVLMQGEVPLALVRSGQLPGWLAVTNDRDVAWQPLIVASTLSCVLMLVASWGNGAGLMDFMIRLTSDSGIWIYAFACIAALVLKVRRLAAGLGLLFAAGLFYGGGRDIFLLSLALMAMALPLYWLARRGTVRTATASG